MPPTPVPSARSPRSPVPLLTPLGDEPAASARPRFRSILLVVGPDGADSAAPRVASYLAARDAAALRVVSLDDVTPEFASPDSIADHVCRTAVHHTSDLIVLDQLRDIGTDAPGCTTRMAVIGVAPTAILALGAPAPQVAREIVLATDFSRASLRAAREALRVAAPRRVHLVHVANARRALPFGASAESGARDAATAMLFGAMAPTLALTPDVEVNCVTLSGEPATALLEYAERVHADLIGVGRHGRHGGARTELGPIAAEITRRARCGVFIPAGGDAADRLTVA